MRILIVEDDHKIATALKKGLEQDSYAVDVAFDGSEGLDCALAAEYDLIILDRMLPKMDGTEVCKEIRRAKDSTPILMLTAKGQVHERVEGLDAGADDYLLKPFAFEELLARMRALVRRPKDVLGAVLVVEDLSLDTKNFSVKRGEKDVQLSNKEFSLLEYLMKNANKTLKKEQIINHVWDYDADILPNTLEVFIGNLRKKIDRQQGTKALIHTVRGFGYRLGSKDV